MCDYSLTMYRNRPAQAGERYVTHRFNSGTVGLISPGDCETAICMPGDTRLTLEGVPEELQQRWHLPSTETATFVLLDRGPFRDGIRFGNGVEMSLQALGPGIQVAIAETVEELGIKATASSAVHM